MVNALVRTQPSLLDGSLRLLLEKPRLLDFDNKRSHIRAKLKKLAEGEAHQHRGAVRVQINRKQVLTDSFTQLQHLKPAEIRGKLTIQFSGEEGIDAGGLTREWYMLLAREMFNPEVALFELSPSGDGAYQPFSNSGINELHLSYFKFIGRIIGKAVYDGYLVDAHFTRPFYKHMLGIPLNYDDMEAFDPDYHRNLVYMLEHPLAESGLDHLTFSETSMYFDVETNVELIPGGHDVPVTDDNKLEYVNLVTAHRMTNAIKDQIAAFTEGFNDIAAARRHRHPQPERARAPHQRHPGHRRRGSPRQHRVPGIRPLGAPGALVLGGCARTHRGGPRATAHVRHGDVEGAARRVQGAPGHQRAAAVPNSQGIRRGTAPLQRAHVLQSAGSSRVRHQGGTQGQAPLRHSRGIGRVRIRLRD